MNWGKNATKNKIPLGLVTADKKPWLNNLEGFEIVLLVGFWTPIGSDRQT
jgi:hypothetical protein